MQRLRATIQRIQHDVARLRRKSLRGRAAIALLALLSIGLLEPLACILHCDVFLPLVAARQHAHHQHGITFANAVDDPVVCAFGMSPTVMLTHAATQSQAGMQLPGTHLTDSVPSAPFSAVPAPFHEMALTLVVLLCAAPLLLRWCILPLDFPPHRADPPLLQPPTFEQRLAQLY